MRKSVWDQRNGICCLLHLCTAPKQISLCILLNCSEKAALVSLKASDWNLEGAFEFFFNQPPARPATDPRFLEELYLRYKGLATITLVELYKRLLSFLDMYVCFLDTDLCYVFVFGAQLEVVLMHVQIHTLI